MPTVEWINARGVSMKKHYTYSKQGIADANQHMARLKNQGLTATVTHKYSGKTLGGSKYKKVTSPSAEMTFAPERNYKAPPPKRRKPVGDEVASVPWKKAKRRKNQRRRPKFDDYTV
tara:strand:- start:447 stop:797 length:351 start_codon:yes stop_codon:yes gene_type:complete